MQQSSASGHNNNFTSRPLFLKNYFIQRIVATARLTRKCKALSDHWENLRLKYETYLISVLIFKYFKYCITKARNKGLSKVYITYTLTSIYNTIYSKSTMVRTAYFKYFVVYKDMQIQRLTLILVHVIIVDK